MADSAQLLAMLEVLPLDVIAAHVWTQLPGDARGSLNLSCRQSRALVDQLITSATLSVHVPKGSRGSTTRQRALAKQSHSRQQAEQSSFLARLPRLTALDLQGWRAEADLAAALAQWGPATGGRVTRLALRGERLSAVIFRAVRLACPRLRRLELENFSGEGRGRGGSSLDLRGALFDPLHGAPLIELDIGTEIHASCAMLRSLGGLRSLQCLTISLHTLDTSGLRHLSGLVNLRHCDIANCQPSPTLVQASALFASPHLVTLTLHGVDYRGSSSAGGSSSSSGDSGSGHGAGNSVIHRVRHHDSEDSPDSGASQDMDSGSAGADSGSRGSDSDSQDAAPSGRGWDTPAQVAQALRLLGALSRLQSLELGYEFLVDDAAFAAIARLTQLTKLAVGGIALTAPTPGHLPLLASLTIGPPDEAVAPSRFLRTLLPLLPLPSLSHLLDDADPLQFDISHPGEAGDGAALARDLKALMTLLATAPRLAQRVSKITLVPDGKECRFDDDLLTLDEIADSLAPLGGRLRCLALSMFEDVPAAGWGAVQGALPGLVRLELEHSQLHTPALTAIVEQLTGLRELSLEHCTGPRAKGWVRLAGQCGRPLSVRVVPAVLPEVVERCREVQGERFGTQHITWVGALSECEGSSEDAWVSD